MDPILASIPARFRGGHPESGHGTSIRIPERSCPLFRFTGFRLAIVPLGITAQFKRIVHEESTGDNNAAADHKTVFSELLKSDLSQQELSLDRLKHEALSIIGGEVGEIPRLFPLRDFNFRPRTGALTQKRNAHLESPKTPSRMP